MIQFIENKMEEIFNDFKENLNKEEYYCILKKFRFNSNNLPDYNETIIQQFYLLKYIPAYFIEYYYIYKDAINKEFLNDKLNILSIGCGCAIDLWSIHYAIKDSDKDIKLRYTGLDIIEWNYLKNSNDEAYFLNDDIGKLSILDEEEYNTIIFPKSIGEFKLVDFNNFKNCIKNTNFTSDKIMIIASMRNKRIDDDIERVKEIINEFLLKGYRLLDDEDEYTCFNNKENGYPYRLNDIISNFIYPNHIKEFMINLYKNCQGYIENGDECCECECKEILSRYPITTMSQVVYTIIRLEKESE